MEDEDLHQDCRNDEYEQNACSRDKDRDLSEARCGWYCRPALPGCLRDPAASMGAGGICHEFSWEGLAGSVKKVSGIPGAR